MIDFKQIKAFGRVFNMREITYAEALYVVQIEKQYEQRRLTKFLNYILSGEHDALELTIQERYFLLLRYLENQPLNKALDQIPHVVASKYIQPSITWQNEVTEGEITVKQLTGKEAEYIEANTKQIQEKFALILVFQYKNSTMGLDSFIPNDLEDDAFQEAIKAKLAQVKTLVGSDVDVIYDQYTRLNSQLMSHLTIQLNQDGFVIRGTDDAPMRFCTISALPRCFRDME